MPGELFRKDVQQMLGEGAQVVEVLEAAQYREAHLPGALHIHLPKLRDEAPKQLDSERPVIVYCNDSA